MQVLFALYLLPTFDGAAENTPLIPGTEPVNDNSALQDFRDFRDRCHASRHHERGVWPLSADDGHHLQQPLAFTDHLGDMDFKVAGTSRGVTALQMDIKIDGITEVV